MDPRDGSCIFAGAIDVPIYPTLTPPQMRYILQDSGASVLVLAGRAKFLELKDILAECRTLSTWSADAAGLSAGEGVR